MKSARDATPQLRADTGETPTQDLLILSRIEPPTTEVLETTSRRTSPDKFNTAVSEKQ